MRFFFSLLFFGALLFVCYSFTGLKDNICIAKIQVFNPEGKSLKDGFLIKTSGNYKMVRFSERDNAYILKYEENREDTLKLEIKETGYLPGYIGFKLTDKCKEDTIYLAITLNYLKK